MSPFSKCSCCQVCKETTGRKLDEVLEMLKSIEVGTASKSSGRDGRRTLEKIASHLEESNINLHIRQCEKVDTGSDATPVLMTIFAGHFKRFITDENCVTR